MKKNKKSIVNEIKKAEKMTGSNEPIRSEETVGAAVSEEIENLIKTKTGALPEAEKTEEVKESPDIEKAEEAKEPPDAEKTEEVNEPPETEKTEEVNEPPETEKTEEVNEPPETEEAEGTPETEKAEETKETPESEKAKEAKEAKEPSDAEKAEEAKEPPETKKAEEPGEASKTPETEKAENQGISEDADIKLSEKKKFSWNKCILILAISLAGILLIIYIVGIIYFRNKFLFNTFINGINASYCTEEEADQYIAKELSKYKITLVERGGAKEIIIASQIDYHYVPKGEVGALQKEQNIFAWPVSLWQETELFFDSATIFDVDKLDEAIEGLRCFDSDIETAPVDAKLEFYDTTYRIVKEDEGNKVDCSKLCQVMEKVVEKSTTQINLEELNCYESPKIKADNQELNDLLNGLNQYAKTKITYKFGENTEVLDGTIIKDWLSFDENGNVTLDESRIPRYVAGLALKYDTYNQARNFKTNDGSYVTVEGGHYGWKIDQELESQELLELVRLGITGERTANFAQTAVSWNNSDLGDSYVEIDLTKQHLWMYVNGQVVVSSDFVSGDMSRGSRRTPSGTFSLYYKKSPAVLKSTKPGDSYETPVTYWMPFNGGIGMHDANWRWSFGGSIYTYNGSHGCINLPTDAARSIYELIYEGFPIICFYR